VLAVVLVFGLTFMTIRLIGNRLGRSTRNSVLGPFDRVLGLGFGMVKGLIAATIAFLLMSQVYDVLYGRDALRPGWMTASRTYDLLRASSAALVSAVEAGRKP
jgi:membrane protein required for colicin V production